ncbi:chemotaxis protein CheW [Planctomicrobium piriforme]|uniref:Chemotaxis signal transduction protein n=1 Tax=Planctomicrobium piriforme TaxID=1576369 RepID=A0A1I3QKU4_9PLAN|nr:chemotaxis protein CheW [Planctomicrobium piriforme]SFJ33796.1 Chemotaxis signal transduction protein [Planctomicrobium piriforme]
MSPALLKPQNGAGTYLSVRIGSVLHAIPITAIAEILPALPIEPIVQCPPYVRGVVFVRGHLIPVLDGAARLQTPRVAATAEPNIVCLQVRNRLVGLEVDEALELVQFEAGTDFALSDLHATTQLVPAVVDYRGELLRVIDPEYLLSEQADAELLVH